MQVTVMTGASPGNMVPSAYHVSFDLSEPWSHFGERMEGVFRSALDFAVDGITSIGIKMQTEDKVDTVAELKKVGLGTIAVAATGSIAAIAGEYGDLMSNTHNVPAASWVSYRNSVSFVSVQPDDGNDNTPLIFNYKMNGGVAVKTSSDGMDFTGTAGNNTIYGTERNNIFKGAGGTDKLIGNGGNDQFYLDYGDNVQGNYGRDRFDFTDSGGKNVVYANYKDDYADDFGTTVAATVTKGTTWMGGWKIVSMTDTDGDQLVFANAGPSYYDDDLTLGIINNVIMHSDFFI